MSAQRLLRSTISPGNKPELILSQKVVAGPYFLETDAHDQSELLISADRHPEGFLQLDGEQMSTYYQLAGDLGPYAALKVATGEWPGVLASNVWIEDFEL